jgi:predicted patatin/cPLA2 family phospholipase
MNGQLIADGFKLGLAVEGGGMRGVVSGAMLVALDDLGLKNVFDGYYGTSSGSMNLAYFLTNWRWEALRMYYDFLAPNDFISLSRPLRHRKPIVDMNLLYDEIMHDVLPLDFEAAAAAVPRLHVAVSAVDEGRGIIKSAFKDGDELRQYLRAGAWLPILAGTPEVIEGRRYVDGGVFFANPMYVAMEDSCTHILSLSTRPEGPGRVKPSLWQHYLARHLDRWHKGAGDVYLSEIRRYIHHRNSIGFGETEVEGTKVFRLATASTGHSVGRLTTDRGQLLQGIRAGYLAVLQQIGRTDTLRGCFSIEA